MVRFVTGDEQSHSKFFTKLHPDVRREIFLHLFGSRHVHIMFANSIILNQGEEFWRHGHPPHTHRGYEEGIPFLYSTNTFLFEKSLDVVNFNTIAIDYMHHVRSLELHIDLREAETWRKETDAFRLMVSTLSDWYNWCTHKPIKIRVVDELEDTLPKRQKQKVRRETQREFGRAVRALAERVSVEVILGDKGDKEIIQPRSPLDQLGVSFVNASEHFPDRQGDEDQGIDSDDDDAFHRVIRRVYRAGI
ncbi:hypothetical protein NW754_009933 [Fusarium falciforme]|nr:hypothetical protein NW754_009933 [Fusarium falciforme]